MPRPRLKEKDIARLTELIEHADEIDPRPEHLSDVEKVRAVMGLAEKRGTYDDLRSALVDDLADELGESVADELADELDTGGSADKTTPTVKNGSFGDTNTLQGLDGKTADSSQTVDASDKPTQFGKNTSNSSKGTGFNPD